MVNVACVPGTENIGDGRCMSCGACPGWVHEVSAGATPPRDLAIVGTPELAAELARRGYVVTSLELQRATAARSAPFSAVASFPGSSSVFVPHDRVASVERALKAGSVPFRKHAARGGTSFVVRDGDVAKVQEAGKRRALAKLRRETW